NGRKAVLAIAGVEGQIVEDRRNRRGCAEGESTVSGFGQELLHLVVGVEDLVDEIDFALRTDRKRGSLHRAVLGRWADALQLRPVGPVIGRTRKGDVVEGEIVEEVRPRSVDVSTGRSVAVVHRNPRLIFELSRG